MLDFGYYHMDCMEGMQQFPDKYFDLAIVDPPYGIGENGKKQKTRGKLAKAKEYEAFTGGDSEAPGKEYFDELFRVSKNQIIWGANHFISRIPYDSHCWIVWDKDNAGSNFADCELAWTSFDSAVRKFQWRWNGMLQEDMKHKEKRIHLTQKPVALYEWILNRYARGGEIILDTHVGSASSLIACYRTGHKFVGFELNENYYNLSKERLDAEMAQMNIFDFIGKETMSFIPRNRMPLPGARNC
jgi:site-specific DNA-methyltransferase (adenine-specific)